MFGSLMGDAFDDMFGGHMRRMNNMMSSFLGNPFGNDMLGGGGQIMRRPASMAMMPFDDRSSNMLYPMPFPNINQMMCNMNQMTNNPNCHSFSSSSVMSMTTGPDGRPQVYQASSSTSSAPGGIRETKKTVCDSRTGVKKMAIGRHVGERAHVKEKEQNMYSGEIEENDEYVNLDEEEAPEFHREWQNKARQFRSPNVQQSIGYHHPSQRFDDGREYLALPPAPSTEINNDHKSKSPPKKKNHRSKPYTKREERKSKE